MTVSTTPSRRPPTVLRRGTSTVLAVLALLALVTVPSTEARAADLSRFDPGLIITDRAFTDAGAMTAAQVQAFLDARAPSCVPGPDGTPCLRHARFDTTSRPADDRCRGAYQGAAGETAAQIITKVAVACSISPRVLLVTLQKEQGLVTASGSSLTATRYRSAMGFGCPDTAACDARYYGFFNQVYQAAWQFNSYALNPTRYAHRPGVTVNVRFHPNAACGSAPVFIANQATASLYNYTPYQPNAAALAAGYGTGDACSSYGNRNFWSYYTDWFGRPDAGDPTGRVESVTTTGSSVTVSGWALDPATSTSNEVHVYVDGVGTRVVADQVRPDIAAAFGMGDRHGFRATVPAAPGVRSVCVYSMGVSRAPFSLLGCTQVTVVDQAPRGALESVHVTGTRIDVSGWTWDPDTSDPTDVHVYVDGVGTAARADLPRADVAAAYGTTPTRGFAHSRTVTPGRHTVCVYAIGVGGGANTLLGCRDVDAVAPDRGLSPVGALESVQVTGTRIDVSGWTWDPDTSDPTDVHVYVAGAGTATRAELPRADVAAAYGTTATRGFAHSRTVGPGRHTVCVYAINTGAGPHTLLGCRDVEVRVPDRGLSPVGALESVEVTGTRIDVSGWTWDPDTSDPTDVHVYVDGVGTVARADLTRGDVAAAYGTTATRGFGQARTAAPGRHTVCVYAINTGPGAHTLLGCRDVEVPPTDPGRTPVGSLEQVQATGDRIDVSGWTWDPDTSDPTDVHVYVDGVGTALRADLVRADVAAAYGTTATRGFGHSRTVAPGRHSVCVYAINTGAGPHTLLGCRDVVTS
ncbi:hypothetical protein GC089_06015 [Cellulomonas sp. JZ18]|uniref:hypothetical protein n=1 Tax=Cellulomonas sp. JZ18 TaxID=2654191 RepID=UPI0012D39BA3|nr:hypothetical protein [Cellulomonas sp. JZ18]QGQ18878.1 hypothetical protein GC089_06015 [Cellulomonas sp. JZ18]